MYCVCMYTVYIVRIYCVQYTALYVFEYIYILYAYMNPQRGYYVLIYIFEMAAIAAILKLHIQLMYA